MAHYAAYARNVFDSKELSTELIDNLTWGEIVDLLGALTIPVPTDVANTITIAKLIVHHNKQRIAAVQLDPKLLEKVQQATSITTISDKYFTKLSDDERLRICSEVGLDLVLDEKKRMAERIRDALHPEMATKDWPTTLKSIVTRIKQTQSATSIRKLLNNRSDKELMEVCHELGVTYNPKESKQKLAMRIAHRDDTTPGVTSNNNNVAFAIPITPTPDRLKVQLYDLQHEIRVRQQLVLTLEQQLAQCNHHHQQQH